MIREVITEESFEAAAGNEGYGGQVMTILLNKLKDEVQESISTEVVKEAAGNQAHGVKIMSILLDQLKDEVCRSISEGVVKAAAGNLLYGAQIMERLLEVCGDEVCEKLSFAVICTAAQNEESGALVLYLLLKANKEKVSKLIGEVDSRAAKGEVWLKDISLELGKRLYEIPNKIGYPITCGMRVEQCLTLLEYAPPWLTAERCSVQLGS